MSQGIAQPGVGKRGTANAELVWAGVALGLITVPLAVEFGKTVHFRLTVGDPAVRKKLYQRRIRDIAKYGFYDPARPRLRRFKSAEERRAWLRVYQREYMRARRAKVLADRHSAGAQKEVETV